MKFLPALLVLLSAPAWGAPNDVVARAGTLTMTQGDVTALLQGLDPQTRARVEAQPNGLVDLVRARLTTEAVVAEANAKNWAATPDVARQIGQARDNVILRTWLESLSKPDPAYPPDQLVQNTYDANKSKFVVARQYHLAQLLMPVVAGAKDGGARQAADLRRRAAGSDRAFAAAAKGPGVTQTDLGWIGEDRLQPSIRDAVGGLSVGGVSDPVRLADGFHIFKLVATKPAQTATLAEVRPQIVAALRQQKANENARAYVTSVQRKQHVEINEIALAGAVPK